MNLDASLNPDRGIHNQVYEQTDTKTFDKLFCEHTKTVRNTTNLLIVNVQNAVQREIWRVTNEHSS